MKLKHRQVPFAFKAVKDDGTFTGYASVFGNADAYRDVVVPGAFAASLAKWKSQDAMPPILWQHDSHSPIGFTTEINEDGKGLHVAGTLLIKDVQQAKEAHALAKAKVVRGLSIGYDPVTEEYDGSTNVNRLVAVDLWEYSFATFPANTEATITSVKSLLAAGDLPSLADFEDFLREAGSFSRSQAKAIASRGLRALLEQRDADGASIDTKEVDGILALIRDNPLKL
jgi:HK97 family phage prohead protease